MWLRQVCLVIGQEDYTRSQSVRVQILLCCMRSSFTHQKAVFLGRAADKAFFPRCVALDTLRFVWPQWSTFKQVPLTQSDKENVEPGYGLSLGLGHCMDGAASRLSEIWWRPRNEFRSFIFIRDRWGKACVYLHIITFWCCLCSEAAPVFFALQSCPAARYMDSRLICATRQNHCVAR